MKQHNLKVQKRMFAIFLAYALILSIAFPVQAKTSSTKISVSLGSKRAVIMDMDSGKVLYSKNAKQKCENASTTKLITAIVAVEKNKSLKKKVKVSAKAASTDGVVLGMRRGDSYYLRDLIHAMLLPSANDCAVAIAEGTSGSVDRFMKEVNKKVKKIGCKNTKFATPNGLRSMKTHYTTAYDLALIMKYAYESDTVRNMLKKKHYSFKSLGGRYHSVNSTNHLLNSKDYYCVGKTGNGWTAKYCYTGVYTYKGHSYVIALLGNASDGGKWSDAQKMIAACGQNAKAVAKKLSLNKTSVEVEVGSATKLKVKNTKGKVKWTSKNKKIATVDGTGKVTGRKVGKTTIQAKIYGKTLKCKVRVIESDTQSPQLKS